MNRIKILVVDDEFGIRAGIERILKNHTISYPFLEEDIDFDILIAETGEQAVEIIDENVPEIILLDNKLPGIQGVEVLKYVNAKYPDILVMMITSYASLDLAVEATYRGAWDFVPKPFTPQELKASIENAAKHLYLKRMTSKLHQDGKQIRFQFLSVLSHELKSPINAVEGYLKMFQNRDLGDSMDDYNEVVERSLVRINGMRTLILDLLDLTKIETGSKMRKLENVAIKELFAEAVDTITPYAIQKDITIGVEHDDDMVVFADREELLIILNNLLSNAVKYNKAGGEVWLRATCINESWRLQVEDTGVGMTKQEQKKLFGEFVRFKNPKAEGVNGSGLGLSIVKKMVEFYGGGIEVHSEPDEGTVFTIVFPKACQE